MKPKIKVLLADDTLIAREGWRKILETVEDIEIVGEAETAEETPEKVRAFKPDVLLMDLKWFDNDSAGAAAIAEIKKEPTATKIVAVTAYPHLGPGARKAGADTYLGKGFSRAELLDVIRAVTRLPAFPASLPDVPPQDQLSEREIEILGLMAQGLRDKEMADELVIASSTARHHVDNIMSKLGASNRAHAVAIGYKKGLIRRE